MAEFTWGVIAARPVIEVIPNETKGMVLFVTIRRSFLFFYCRDVVSTDVLCRIFHSVAMFPHPGLIASTSG